MPDLQLLSEHYKRRQRIGELEAANEHRKSLIALAVLQILAVRSTKDAVSVSELDLRIKSLSDLNHDHQLQLARLRHLSSTKEKIHEAKIEALVQENARLKQALSHTLKVPSVSSFQPRIALNITRPAAFGKAQSKNYLAPALNSLSKAEGSKEGTETSILSPISRKREVLRLLKGDLFSITNTQDVNVDDIADVKLSGPPAGAAGPEPTKGVPSRTSSQQLSKTLEASNAGTPETTPTKKSTNTTTSILTDMDEPDANSTTLVTATSGHSGILSDDDIFASANSTLNGNMSLGSVLFKKKKKKMLLSRTDAAKLPLGEVKHKAQGKGLNIEDEDLNTLNYYDDDNFKDDKAGLPVANRKRPLSLDIPEPKRRKNVFTID